MNVSSWSVECPRCGQKFSSSVSLQVARGNYRAHFDKSCSKRDQPVRLTDDDRLFLAKGFIKWEEE